MTTQTRALELLAVASERLGYRADAAALREGRSIAFIQTNAAMDAIETALRSELAEVVKVLEPFAEAADYYDALTFGAFDGQIIDISANINVGQLRAARDLLATLSLEREGQ